MTLSPIFQWAHEEEILKLVLEQTGPVTIPEDRLAAHDRDVLDVVGKREVTGELVVSVRRPPTLADRLTRALELYADRLADSHLDLGCLARELLEDLDMDPDHIVRSGL